MNNDLISRSELKKAFEKWWGCDDIPSNVVEDLIDNAPTVNAYTEEQVKELVDLNKKLSGESELVKAYTKGFDTGVETVRPQGEWEEGNHGDYERPDIYFQCSVCKEETDDETPYCPYCGAKMKGNAE